MLNSMTGSDCQTADVDENDYETESLICWDCNVNFTSEFYLNNHLLHHIKQPWVLLTRVQEPIKITLKSRSDNSFEIISSPTSFTLSSPQEKRESESPVNEECPEQDETYPDDSILDSKENLAEGLDIPAESESDGLVNITFSPNFVEEHGTTAEDNSNDSGVSNKNIEDEKDDITKDYENIPGAEPTPPPEPSPEYPKIRIKSSGLLMKEPLTITELTDDNPHGDIRPEIIELNNSTDNSDSAYGSTSEDSIWATPSLEDPLRLPDGADTDGSLISSLFSNNNDRAKDLGFTSSESEFISLDRFDDRNRNALQVYSSASSTSLAQNPLDTLAGLPMQQLAEQVSRLQPSSGQMHQQNVLINIQQFQQPPPPQPHAYQPPPMYPHPPHPGQPMYHQPYQYQPPNPMYYPPAPGYPPPMPPPPPRPPMSQPQMPQPPPQQMGQPMTSMAQAYRPTAPRPSMAPRQPLQPQRGQIPPRQPLNPRQPMMPRQRAPMVRPRGMPPMGMRGPRPRMNGPSSGQMQQQNQQGPRMVKRTPEQIQALQAKRKRMDVLVPDKHDDPDCQVIAVQPKNTGLPQIQSVQGNAPEPADNSVMHLSDSITLSVRNPPVRPASPKKSDAKAVANILATRGITVTAAPKPKKADTPPKKSSPPPVAINLNSAVSIIPANKSPTNSKPSNSGDSKLPTVDLTDDTAAESIPSSPTKNLPPKTMQTQKVLPFQCDLCPAKYPNSLSLNKHRQSFHKTGGLTEFGIPLIDLKQPGLVQRLTSFGIYNYIPLPGASSDTTFALPIISASNRNAANNMGNMGVTSILTLGPIRSLPRPVQNNNVNK